MTKERQQVESLVYNVMDTLDNTGQNTTYYKSLFANLDDKEFINFCKRDLVFRFHIKPFNIEPKMDDIKKTLDILGVPLLEKVAMPYLYTNHNGEPVMSKESLVIYIHIKKMKQFITKKNAMSTGIDERDMKTGLLVSIDKNGLTTDREMEALTLFGLEKTRKELATWRADYMDSKSKAYQIINITGKISEKDIKTSARDSLSKNLLNSYMIGAGLYTNILNMAYMLPYTLEERQRKTIREV